MSKEIHEMDTAQARHLLTTYGPAAMYDYMAEFGDKYAVLANGVARGDTLVGKAALRHMEEIANRSGKCLSEEDVNKIRFDMAKSYLEVRVDKNDGEDYTQLTWEEAQEFHREVFANNGLSEKCWTMEVPLNVLSKEKNDDLWGKILDSAGDSDAELSISKEIAGNMSGVYYASMMEFKHRSYRVFGDHEKTRKVFNEMSDIGEWVASNVFSFENVTEALLGTDETKFVPDPKCVVTPQTNAIEPPAEVESMINPDESQATPGQAQAPAVDPQQRQAAMAEAFLENPEQAAQTYPELERSRQVLEKVSAYADKIVEVAQKKLAQQIKNRRPVPAPAQVLRASINAISGSRDLGR